MKAKKKTQKPPKYQLTFIHRENYEISLSVESLQEIKELPLRYVLKCINGMYRNRSLFISTNPEGELIGAGSTKDNALTLQIEGARLSLKHIKLVFDGVKGFEVMDFGSESGTWMDIVGEGVEINDGDVFTVGPHDIRIKYGKEVDEIEELCQMYRVQGLTERLMMVGITTVKLLFEACKSKFLGCSFDEKTVEKLQKVCEETRAWYNPSKKHPTLILIYTNSPLRPFEQELSWQPYSISSDPEISSKNIIAYIHNYKLVPRTLTFQKLTPKIFYPFRLHSRIKLGDLEFTLERFNVGSNANQGNQLVMEDGLIVDEIGGLDYLMSLFCVIDGHGGVEAMQFIRSNLKKRISGWSSRLNKAEDVNRMLKGLIGKTLMDLDYEFYKEFPNSATCGATVLIVIIIQSRVFVYNLGACKGLLLRNGTMFQINTEHKPTLGDERIRLEKAGAFVKNDRLLGKCPISRCIGQFEFKNIEDYEGEEHTEFKSYLSCVPDSTVFDLNCETDEFLVIGTEGLFNALSNIEIVDFIFQKLEKIEVEESPDKIVDGLIRLAKAKGQCSNMAVVLLVLKKGAYQNDSG